MAGVFLSHNYRDKPFARRLAADLRDLGAKVWIDEAEIRIGDSLIERISQGVSRADYLVVLLSQHSIDSEWVKRELEIALNHEIGGRKVKVLPSRLDDSPLPEFLAGKLYADFRKDADYRAELTKLAESLGISTIEISDRGHLDGSLIARTRSLSRHFGRQAFRFRAAVLALVVSVCVVLGLEAVDLNVWSAAGRCVRLAKSPLDRPPLGAADRDRITATVNHLRDTISADLKGQDAWSYSQIVVALGKQGIPGANAAEFYDRAQLRPLSLDGKCWHFVPTDPCHVVTTSWALLGLSILGLPSVDGVTFLLAAQQKSGAWCAFRCDELVHKSTYATAFSILALSKQLPLLPGGMREAVQQAVDRASSWLVTSRIVGQGRWYMFPNLSRKVVSLSDSALAVHALSVAHALKADVAEEWLSALPASLPAASSTDEQTEWISGETNTWFSDSIKRLQLPWLLIGTTDAFKKATGAARYRGLALLDKVSPSVEAISREAVQPGLGFVQIELVIALRYMLGDTVEI